MNWLRWYTGTSADPKWAMISKRAGVSKAVVIALWAALLEHALEQEPRGRVDNFDPEFADCMLDLEEGSSSAVIQALTDKGLITDGVITAWDKRQYENERHNSNERVKRFREKQRDGNKSVTACNGDVMKMKWRETLPDTETDTDTETETEKTGSGGGNPAVTPQSTPEGNPVGDERSSTSANASNKQQVLLDDRTPEEQEVLSLFQGVEDLKQPNTKRLLETWRDLKAEHPQINMLSEAKKMAAWLEGQTKAKRQKSNVVNFMRNWIERAARDPTPRAAQRHRQEELPPMTYENYGTVWEWAPWPDDGEAKEAT